ncbi:hypothetical protein BDB01DRAFT_784030 [Pilobolus umbonatus]|nr:hypothetical protein BDB01DRAFT_784030 [Pilobolus umbonatus]
MAFLRASPLPHEDWDGKHNMSKTTSTTSGSYSVSSNSSRQTSASIQETTARTYYAELERYLVHILAKEAAEGVPSQRSTARQKLSKLNNTQFHELATDVYDELLRRIDERSNPSMREEFHPRRNQARQKLATLSSSRFRDLASDVYHELKRRYPPIVEQLPPMPTQKGLESQAHPSQSTNIIPTMGMISVEQVVPMDDSDGNRNISSLDHAPSIDSLMADLGNMVKSPPPELYHQQEYHHPHSLPKGDDTMRYEYEMKISTMAKRIQMLELSLNESSHNNMDSQQMNTQQKFRQMQEEYRQLDEKYTQLSTEHQQQQEAVRKVKDEIKQLLGELKNLSSTNEELRIEKEQAEETIQQLTAENKTLKSKCDNMSIELRSFKARSLYIDKLDLQPEFLKPNKQGAINQQHVIEYQTAVDELIRTSRSSKPSDAISSMRTIVMACKSITSDVEDHEMNVGVSPKDQQTLYDLKKKFSVALSSLLVATKNFASSMGVIPTSLVDAAVGDVTNIIVEIVQLLGMRPVDMNEMESKVGHHQLPPLAPYQLSEFLKAETDHIVMSVQNLLGALRSNDSDIFNKITSIIDIVSHIVDVSKQALSFGDGMRYNNTGSVIIGDLEKCNRKITQIRNTSFKQTPDKAPAIDKRNLAQESYEIAKYTKELINMLEMQ